MKAGAVKEERSPLKLDMDYVEVNSQASAALSVAYFEET